MRIKMPPPLQRDMYVGWDSSKASNTTKPTYKPKPLDITNIDKLVGTMTSQIMGEGYVCIHAIENRTHYELHYNGTAYRSGKRMEVIIQKEPRMYLDEHQEVHYSYLVEVRKRLIGGHIVGISHSSPAVYPASPGVFSNPNVFSNWIDGKLRKRELDFEKEIYKRKPWYEKAFIKVTNFFRTSKMY